MGHKVSIIASSQEEHCDNDISGFVNKSNDDINAGYAIVNHEISSRRRRRRCRHPGAPSTSSYCTSSWTSNLTLVMIAVASASKVAAGGSSFHGGGGCGACCFAAAPSIPNRSSGSGSSGSSSSSTALSASSAPLLLQIHLPPLSTLLSPFTSSFVISPFIDNNKNNNLSSSRSRSSSSSSSSSTSIGISSTNSLVAAAVVPPPNSRLARLKNRNKGRTSENSRTDLRYSNMNNNDNNGNNSSAGGYAPYEELIHKNGNGNGNGNGKVGAVKRRRLFSSSSSSSAAAGGAVGAVGAASSSEDGSVDHDYLQEQDLQAHHDFPSSMPSKSTYTSHSMSNSIIISKSGNHTNESNTIMHHPIEQRNSNKNNKGNNITIQSMHSTTTKKQHRDKKRARMARFIHARFTRLRSKKHHHVAHHDASSTSSTSYDSNYHAFIASSSSHDSNDSSFTTKQNNNKHNIHHHSDNNKSTTPNSPPTTPEEYQKRKAAWAAKYTSVTTLRSTFGTNKNRLWGDFDPKTTRQLYHTLLPRALLGLHDLGLSSVDELAPLAYQARVAAKKYARERSMLPGRIGSMLYDGFRQWKRYGKFDHRGMTWEQVWRKYEDQILREVVEEIAREGEEEGDDGGISSSVSLAEKALLEYADALDDEELTARICLRILERSVVTNEAIDKLFLKRIMNGEEEEEDLEEEEEDSMMDGETRRQRKQVRRQRRKLQIQADLKAIEKKFDDDIRELLLHGMGASLNGQLGEEGEGRMIQEGSGAKKGKKREKIKKFFSFSSDSSSSEDAIANANEDDALSPTAASAATAGHSTASFARGGATATTDTGTKATQVDETNFNEELAASIFSMANFEYHEDGTIAAANIEGDENIPSSSSPSAMNKVTESLITTASTISVANNNEQARQFRRLAVHEVFALRILASTKQRIASLHSLSNGNQYGKKETLEGDNGEL